MSSVALTPIAEPSPPLRDLPLFDAEVGDRRLRLAERIALLRRYEPDDPIEDTAPEPAPPEEPVAEAKPELETEPHVPDMVAAGHDNDDVAISEFDQAIDAEPEPAAEVWTVFGVDFDQEPQPEPLSGPDPVAEAEAEAEIAELTETAPTDLPPAQPVTAAEAEPAPEAEPSITVDADPSMAASAALAAALAAAAGPEPATVTLQPSAPVAMTETATEPAEAGLASAEIVTEPGPIMPAPAIEEQDARTVAAAAELVTLLAKQRSLIDAMARLTGDGHEPLAEQPRPDALVARPPAAVPPPAPAPMLMAPPVFAAPREISPPADQDRPPIIIERAHAAQRAGGAVFDGPYEELPSRLPAFATGFALAMLTGGALYIWQMAG